VLRPDRPDGSHDFGANWYGLTDALQRLFLGFDPAALQRLVARGVDPALIQAWIDAGEAALPLISDGMPIQDAVDFAQYAADVNHRTLAVRPRGAARRGRRGYRRDSAGSLRVGEAQGVEHQGLDDEPTIPPRRVAERRRHTQSPLPGYRYGRRMASAAVDPADDGVTGAT